MTAITCVHVYPVLTSRGVARRSERSRQPFTKHSLARTKLSKLDPTFSDILAAHFSLQQSASLHFVTVDICLRIIVDQRRFTQIHHGKTYPLQTSKAISQLHTCESYEICTVKTAIKCHVSSLSTVVDDKWLEILSSGSR